MDDIFPLIEPFLDDLLDDDFDLASIHMKICTIDLERKMSQLLSHFAKNKDSGIVDGFKEFCVKNDFQGMIAKVPAMVHHMLPALRLFPSYAISIIRSMFAPYIVRNFLDFRLYWVSPKLQEVSNISENEYAYDVLLSRDGNPLTNTAVVLNELLAPFNDRIVHNFLNLTQQDDLQGEMKCAVARQFKIDEGELTLVFASPFYFQENGIAYFATMCSKVRVSAEDDAGYMPVLFDQHNLDFICSAQFWDDGEYDDIELLLERFLY